MRFVRYGLPAALLSLGTSVALAAPAAAVDVTDVTTSISNQLAALAAIGAGWLIFKVIKKIWAKLG